MYNHAPKDYVCPICLGIQGVENEHTLVRKEDLIYKDAQLSAFINSFFIGNNPGHVIIVPNEHIENIYDLPDEIASLIAALAKKIALALKQAYSCEGVTLLQNNEPASNQHAFHYHMHLFPRYKNDKLHAHMGNKQLGDPKLRAEFAAKLKKFL